MPRTARVIAEGYPHHVTQRGNYRQKVFNKEGDFKEYLLYVKEYIEKNGIKILSYCLMNNHVHFIAVPENADSLGKTFRGIHMKYSQYANKQKGETGQLWQGRYYSSVIDRDYLAAAIRYVEKNPERARMVKKAKDWKWSSASQHIGGKIEGMEVEALKESIEIEENKWERYLEDTEEEKMLDIIRKNTSTGRPVGGERFIEKLEDRLKRRLKALPWGRPKKEKH